MKIDLHVDTDTLPDDVIVIERSKGPQGWVIRRKGQRTDRPPEVHRRLDLAIVYAGQGPASGPCTLIVCQFSEASRQPLLDVSDATFSLVKVPRKRRAT